MTVSYGLVENFEGWSGASALFQSLIEIHSSKRILEIGSGANPTLTPEYVRANGLSYVTSDLSSEELAKADSAFETLVLDMSANNLDPTFNGSFDLICSRMVNEHIRSGRQYHSNIHSLLRPGGIAVHCFSTLWTLPFAANRALPEPLSDFLLRVFNPREDAHKTRKIPGLLQLEPRPYEANARALQRPWVPNRTLYRLFRAPVLSASLAAPALGEDEVPVPVAPPKSTTL